MKNKYVIYDLESFVNCFTGTFLNNNTGQRKQFVIHESRNDIDTLYKFLQGLIRNNYWLVGFNCNAYDNQLLEYILHKYDKIKKWKSAFIAEELSHLSNQIINLPIKEKYKQLIGEWDFSIPHIDIFKQKHYDGKSKHCSLKWLEFTMRMENIETMPWPQTTFITKEMIPKVLSYNSNDVDATKKAFDINNYETDLRLNLSKEYHINLLNASEPKLTRDIFGKFLTKEMNIKYTDLKKMRTYRQWIKIANLIFPIIKFKDPVLQGVKKFYETLEFNPYKFEENNKGLEKKVQKTFEFGNLSKLVTGLGGIHGCINSGIYTSSPIHCIHDLDVTSYYPNLAIENKLHPFQLPQHVFCKVYEHLFNLRQTFDKKDPRNGGLKIVLNSTYGLSKESNNYFHDPNYTFSITINGQLLLLMLGELLITKVPEIIFYQWNTDGMTIGYNPSYKPLVEECMKKWSDYTKMKLEDKFYSKMVIVDVNNYIAVDDKGKICKRKGLFGYSLNPADKEMDYHKNPSMLVVPKALEAFFINGISIEKFINNCEDIFDFCIGVKIKKDFKLMRYWSDENRNIQSEQINQTVCRFYVSKENSSLKKVYDTGTKQPGQKENLIAKRTQTYFNIYVKKSMKDYNIDYSYYIAEARKIIGWVEGNAQNIKLFD